MSTSSMIAYVNTDGTVTASYCHYDGYTSGVGKTLSGFYNNNAAACEVASGGYLSSLEETYSESKEKSVNNDAAETFGTLKEFLANTLGDVDYVYWWTPAGQWECAKSFA